MITAALNIAWSIAELEASAAGFEKILPAHFWIGCCKGCDLDYAVFLREAKPEIKKLEVTIAEDFKAVREALVAAKTKPTTLRRALRAHLGSGSQEVIELK